MRLAANLRKSRAFSGPPWTPYCHKRWGLGGNRGQGRQFGVGLVVAGKEGHQDVPVPADAGDFVAAMGPIAAPAEKPDDDQLGVGDDVFGVMIDGMVVAEVQQAGEPEAGEIRGVQFRPRLRQRRQFHILSLIHI